MEGLYIDIRNKNIVRIVKKINATDVIVLRLRDKARYITELSNLQRVNFK